MDTKEKILQTALELYNSKGLQAITSRHIAAGMGISPGNLHYHFKHTDDIIKTLYDRMATGFDGLVSEMETSKTVDIDAIGDFITRSMELTYKYRFILLHFVEIALRIPAIKTDYSNIVNRRTKEFIGIFKKLVKSGTFRNDLPNEVWPALVTQIFIVGDFWLSNNQLTNELAGKEAVNHYKKIFKLMFLPYLRK